MHPATFLLGSRTLNRMGFGAMQLPGPGVFGPPRDRDEALAVLRLAVQRGVNHIDTAQYYGPEVANELIRDALHPYADDLAIVSKVGARRDERGAWLRADRPEELRQGVEDNLRTLAAERLALVNLRRMEGTEVPLAEQLGALAELRAEGKIEAIGLSNVSVEQLEEGLAVTRIAEVQNAYNLRERASRPLLEATRERRIAFVPFFPLGSAFTGGPARLAQDPAVQQVAAKHGATPAQVLLAWTLAQGEHVLLIPGTSSRAHLGENLAAGDIALDADDLAALG